MTNVIYTPATREIVQTRRDLALDTPTAFDALDCKGFAEGALSTKMKRIVSIFAAYVTQCSYCIKRHAKAALRLGAACEALMEVIWTAAEMRAGAAYVHSALAISTLDEKPTKRGPG